MSRCQQWISAWMSLILTLLLLMVGVGRVQAQPVLGSMAYPKSNQSHSITFAGTVGSAFVSKNGKFALGGLLPYESGKGIDYADIRREDQQIRQRKQLVRQPFMQNTVIPNLELASRAMFFTEYAQFQRAQLGQKVAVSALNYIGRPYIWGGTTPSGFDCSGFTQYVLSTYGIKIPRNSYDQFAVGQSVSKDQLQPGDLVFFSTYAPGPSHLGIFVGDGKFVHALNHTTGVITSKLDTEYYKEHFVGARRVL